MDLDRVPGLRGLIPLPGRVGGDVFVWTQDVVKPMDRDACVQDCDRQRGAGWEVRYEQFLSNLFGIYSAVRAYSPPASDVWSAFGPMLEIPLADRSNVNLHAGVAFRPAASPRFELSVSMGVWKPKTNHVGIRARKGES
jgi:hypothetical protein